MSLGNADLALSSGAMVCQRDTSSIDDLVILAVIGDEMHPTLQAGQHVMVDTRDRCPSPPGVFAVWDGVGVLLRRIEMVHGHCPPRVRLSSDNTRYLPVELPLAELSLWGRLVAVYTAL